VRKLEFLNLQVGLSEIVVIKFEKTLTLKEMVYLDGNLSSLRARHDA
jgi:hypothetical protein